MGDPVTDFVQAVSARLAMRETRADELRHAVLDWWDDAALAEARALDAARSDLPLAGLPLSVKANVDVKGARTTAASRALLDAPPAAADAPLVARLRTAGVIPLMQTNMVEFAYGALGPNPHFGTPFSPLFPGEERVTGGSSSGAAVTVALGVVDAAIGTDTSGSVRIPAAACGVAAFKPTQGRYPEEGIVPLALSLDTAGFLARDLTLCDRLDAVVTDRAFVEAMPDLDGVRFVVPAGFIESSACDDAVRARFEAALAHLAARGAVIETRDMAYLAEIGETARAGFIVAAESFVWHRDLLARRAADYDPRVAPRIAAGADVPASTYIAARQRLDALARRFTADLAGAAALLTPTIPGRPPRLADLSADADYLALNLWIMRFTEVANRINMPSLSLPVEGVTSLLLTGHRGDDVALLGLGRAIEAALAAG